MLPFPGSDAGESRRVRAVLLREHSRKPINRAEIKDQVMPEHKAQDRTGRIFKQVLAAANDKLRDIIGLELVPETATGTEHDAMDEHLGSSATQGATGVTSANSTGSAGARYILVNRLADVVTLAQHDLPSGRGQAVYSAFVETVLALISESEGVIKEDDLFNYLKKIGLERDSSLPHFDPDKVETLVQRRLVGEAFVHRRKNARDADTFEYIAGTRAAFNRSKEGAAKFVADVKKK